MRFRRRGLRRTVIQRRRWWVCRKGLSVLLTRPRRTRQWWRRGVGQAPVRSWRAAGSGRFRIVQTLRTLTTVRPRPRSVLVLIPRTLPGVSVVPPLRTIVQWVMLLRPVRGRGRLLPRGLKTLWKPLVMVVLQFQTFAVARLTSVCRVTLELI